MTTDKDGLEMEKGLSTLVEMDECRELLGDSLHFEIQALCCKPGGPNMRNAVAHGLFGDDGARTVNSAYVWWLCLRLVVVPVFNSYEIKGPFDGDEKPCTSDS